MRNSDSITPMRFEFSDHITNSNKGGYVHLGISDKRLSQLKAAYPNLNSGVWSNTKFCGKNNYTYSYSTSGKKWTENPDLVTCQKCLDAAIKLGYIFSNFPMDDEPLRLAKESIRQVANWIPNSCKIQITSKGIFVEDDVTAEVNKVESINKAAILIGERCFKSFDPGSSFPPDLLIKDIYDANNNKYTVQGVNIKKETGLFDGLILLPAKNNNLKNLTFMQLFKSGFHFQDGTPCGEYVEDRKPSEAEKDAMGIDIIDI
jgi:hypothetical protein